MEQYVYKSRFRLAKEAEEEREMNSLITDIKVAAKMTLGAVAVVGCVWVLIWLLSALS